MGEPTSAQKLDPAWVDEFVERWGNAWNAHDPAQLLELLTDDIVYHDSAWPKTMRGKPTYANSSTTPGARSPTSPSS
ncbi:nuclear transport factor 2 family protein [Rhodococcus jostii]|uniref:Nuclear transport factor 2 family protein n=1 Tax=Rhodococcus jostii TaxID=132919 RepID=A0ABU4C6X2_RHOJO|nr:nuclear transport factor 2 family protein [Rhodococcus jostii]MDV6279152.1 nuclear transport factor 2 family protein [Rhodococcus jostii]